MRYHIFLYLARCGPPGIITTCERAINLRHPNGMGKSRLGIRKLGCSDPFLLSTCCCSSSVASKTSPPPPPTCRKCRGEEDITEYIVHFTVCTTFIIFKNLMVRINVILNIQLNDKFLFLGWTGATKFGR